MEKIIITIARQFGSGGKTIGYKIAEELGIRCYDREILSIASEESGINEQLFAKADEKLKKNIFFKGSKKAYQGELIPPKSSEFVSNQNLFNYQAKVIKELASKESCVIIGRAADYILMDNPNVVSVFVHASEEFCLKSALERYTMTEKEMERYIAKTDKYRAEYYEHYTNRRWDDARNYDLCLNSGKLGFEKCIRAIKGYLEIKMS
jgi:cytidylate kinase